MATNKSNSPDNTDEEVLCEGTQDVFGTLRQDAATQCFWLLINRNRTRGDLGNILSNLPLKDGFTLVVTGGSLCHSLPQVDLGSLEDYQQFQVTLHDPRGLIVGVHTYPDLSGFSHLIYERYPATHVGSFVPVEALIDMLSTAGILNVTELLH